MKIIIRTLLILLSLIFTINLSAKKGDKVPGYIILEDGTQVEGIIVIGSITDNEVKVTFIENGKNKKSVYRPTEILSYSYETTEQDDMGIEYTKWVHYDRFKVDYPPKIFASTTVFMEREVDGAITVYCYYVEVRNDPKNPYRYYYYLKDQNGKIEKVERDNFSSVANNIFKDYSALTARIGKKSFEYRNLDRMVRDYNYWVVNQHSSDEYRVAMIEE